MPIFHGCRRFFQRAGSKWQLFGMPGYPQPHFQGGFPGKNIPAGAPMLVAATARSLGGRAPATGAHAESCAPVMTCAPSSVPYHLHPPSPRFDKSDSHCNLPPYEPNLPSGPPSSRPASSASERKWKTLFNQASGGLTLSSS